MKPQRRTCRDCSAEIREYDYDEHLRVYMGPTRVDTTPLSVDLANACRLIGRPIYTWRRDLLGRANIARIWAHHPTPTNTLIIPAHQCGARAPTQLPRRPKPADQPECPF